MADDGRQGGRAAGLDQLGLQEVGVSGGLGRPDFLKAELINGQGPHGAGMAGG